MKNPEFSDEVLPQGINIDSLKSIYRQSLLGLVAYAKCWGVNPVLMTQGSCFAEYEIKNVQKYEAYNLDSLHKEFNKVVRDVALISDVPLVDAENLMEDNKDYFYDTVHYTDSGSIFIANHIASGLKHILN